MKNKIVLGLLIISGAFLYAGCADKVDFKDIRDRLKQRENKDRYRKDCAELGLNFKDACITRDGKTGYVDANCDCVTKETDKRFDCAELGLNFKDACTTRDGKIGYVDANCDCVTKETDKRFDCPELRLNFKDACVTADGKRGYIDTNCDCVIRQ